MIEPENLRTHASRLIALARQAKQRGQVDFAELLLARANKYLSEIPSPDGAPPRQPGKDLTGQTK